MGRKINLSHLSEGECRQILDVIQRDFSIRQREKERLVKLQKLVKDEEQKRLVLSRQKQFNEKYCICCFSSFGLIFNKRTECKPCGFYVCRECCIRPEGLKVMMCLGCVQQRELQVQVCEWFYGQIRNRFRRFGSAKIVRSLYKRDSQSSDSVDQTSNDSGVDHQLSPPARGDVPSSDEAARAFLETLEKQTSTANKDLLGVPYKALLENPDDWLPLFKPEMSSVAVQAPEDVLPDVMSSRRALEDFVFNLPPDEEELNQIINSEKRIARRHSGPEVVVLNPEGELLGKAQDSNRKVHFGEMPTSAKTKETSLASSTSTGAAYHVLSPIEEVLSSPELVDKSADTNSKNLAAGTGCLLKDRGSIDRLSLGEEDKRVRADSSSSISPHDWDSGIHMPLCLSQEGAWEVSQSTPGTDCGDIIQRQDHADQSLAVLHVMESDSEDNLALATCGLSSQDAEDTRDSLKTSYSLLCSDVHAADVSDEFVSSSSTLVESRNVTDENDDRMNGVGIEIEQLTLSRSSSEETLKTDEEEDIDKKIGDLTMQEFLDELKNLSLSAGSETGDEIIRNFGICSQEEHVNPPTTDEISLESTIEDPKQDSEEHFHQTVKWPEEQRPLLGDDDLNLELPVEGTITNKDVQKKKADQALREDVKLRTEERHSKEAKSHHHHSSRSHDSASRGKSTYKRSKSNDEFILFGRSGDMKNNKSSGSKGHRREGEPSSKCTKESHHHGKHHERSHSNRFIRYDSLPLVVEVFEAEGSHHWHHHGHRDFRQFSRESDSNDSEPSNQVASKTSKSGAKLVRAAHLSPKSSYEEEPSQSRQLSIESNTTEDTMPKSTSQSSGPTTPESRRDSQQMVGMSSEEDQQSPDKLFHCSPTEQSTRMYGTESYNQPKQTSVNVDSSAETKTIREFVDHLKNANQGENSQRKSETPEDVKEKRSDLQDCLPERNSLAPKETVIVSTPESHPHQQEVPKLLPPISSTTETLPLRHPSPSTTPTKTSPGSSSPMSNPKGIAALRKDILELANLSKKVSITQEQMLQSAEEVLTSAHKMSSIQTQVKELEDVLDSLERTVIGESSSIYGSSSSENEESIVGPQEQVVEDMQLLEEQLACSNTDDKPSENNAATAVRMITTTALKVLSTTEGAMQSHSASLASSSLSSDRTGEEDFTDLSGDSVLASLQSCSRRSSEEEDMCACSSTDGSRPSSLNLETRSVEPPLDSVQKPEAYAASQRSRKSIPVNQGVPFLHLHPNTEGGIPSMPIATLMCDMDEDVRNGNGFAAAAAGGSYQNGDSAMLDFPISKTSAKNEGADLTFELEGFNKDKAAERRRRKERKLRKSSGLKASPTQDHEVDLLMYHHMAELEEKVYLSAGKVFSLEERLQQLQERVSKVDRTSPEENIIELEDKIALTMAQVAQSETQVAAVEAQITALQRSREGTMNIAGFEESAGQLTTVSVALCDLSSPGINDPFAFRYGSVIQLQIPREYVDTPCSVLIKVPQQAVTENNNNDEQEMKEIKPGVGVPVATGNGQSDIGEQQTMLFAIKSCEVSVELAPISAVIVSYLEEGDDTSLWPDYRFSQKRPKLDMDATNGSHGNEVTFQTNKRHLSTLEFSLGECEDLPKVIPDHQHEVDVVQLAVSELEQLSQA